MKLFLKVILLFVVGFILYNQSDFLKKYDKITFVNTHVSILPKLKVYAFINEPNRVNYKNGIWTDEFGQQPVLVYDGRQFYNLSKKYRHINFYITIDNKFFYNNLKFKKEKQREAFAIELAVSKIDSSYFISAEVFHNKRRKLSLFNHQVFKMTGEMTVTYYRDTGMTKTEFLDQ